MSSNSAAVIRWRQRAKLRAVQAFGGKCGICRYNRCVAAFDFHHLNPLEKDFSFGTKTTPAWSQLVAELKKCVMLCATCHREVHSNVVTIPDDIQRFDESLIVYVKYMPARKPRGTCKTCGGVIRQRKQSKSKYCSDICYSTGRKKVKDRPSRDELRMMVNEHGYEEIGRRFDVTGKSIKKWLM